jgi:hypothetical protein
MRGWCFKDLLQMTIFLLLAEPPTPKNSSLLKTDLVILFKRLVDQQPVQPEATHGANEFIEVHRLYNVAVYSQFIGPLDIGLLSG